MPNIFCRSTALPNVVGRVDYISSDHRQERLLGSYDAASDLLDGQFWETLAAESQEAFQKFGQKTRTVTDHKTGKTIEKDLKCCEGRELLMQLPNSLLDRMNGDEIAKNIALAFYERLGVVCAVGVHLKHFADAEDNLHAHIVFPERQLLQEPIIKIAERNLFFDENGKRRYKKSEILDEDKQLRPGCQIIKKGEVYERHCFGSVDAKYSHRSWTKEIKTTFILPLLNGKLKGDVEFTEYDPSTGKLPQQHVGTVGYVDDPKARAKVEDIKQGNILVKKFNRMVDAGKIPLTVALQIQKKYFESSTKTQTLREEMDKIDQYIDQEQAQQVVVIHPAAVIVAQNERQPIWDLGELAGISRPEIDRMYDTIQRATRADMQLMWAKYRQEKAEFWNEYNAQMSEIRKEINAAYKLRRIAKHMDWMVDPRNRRKSLLGLVVVLIYTMTRKESVRTLDLKINHLKEKQAELRRQAAEFKEISGSAVVALKEYGRPLEEYAQAVQEMQDMADKIQGECAPFMAAKSEPARVQPKQSGPEMFAYSKEGRLDLVYYKALKSTHRKYQQASMKQQEELDRFRRLYGEEREVDQDLIELPKRMMGICDEITQGLMVIQEQERVLHEVPPAKPILAGKKKSELYEQELAKYQERMDAATTTIRRTQKDIAGYLDFLGRYLKERAMRPPMKGELLTAENIDLQDMVHLAYEVQQEAEHGDVSIDARNESRYADGLHRYQRFADAAEKARREYEKVRNDRKVPEEFRERAAKSVEAEWQQEQKSKRSAAQRTEPPKQKGQDDFDDIGH